MMIFQLLFGIALYALVEAIDTAIMAALAKSYIRAFFFSAVSIILLVSIVLYVFGQ